MKEMVAVSVPSHAETPRRRRPWIAFILSLLAPGLGHLYAGRVLQAFLALLVWVLAAAIGVWLLIQPIGGSFAIWTAFLLFVAGWIAVGVHAACVARSPDPLRVNRWLRVGIYVIYLVIFSEAAARAAAWIRSDLAEPFSAASTAMFPTLHKGDYFFADKRAYIRQPPERGDVVVLQVATDSGRRFPADVRPDLPRVQVTYRVLGVPGDRICVDGGEVYLNGNPLPVATMGSSSELASQLDLFKESLGTLSYTIARDKSVSRPDLQEIVVPPDRYIVMGDNRDHSHDSRYWGAVNRADIKARVTHLFFSRDPTTGSVDWTRIGLRVR